MAINRLSNKNKLWHAVVVSVIRRMNEVTLHRVRLVLGSVTVYGRVYHHCTQPAN